MKLGLGTRLGQGYGRNEPVGQWIGRGVTWCLGWALQAPLREGRSLRDGVALGLVASRVNYAMAAMPRSNVNVQPPPPLPDLQHCHVAKHIALTGGCSLAHNVFLWLFKLLGTFVLFLRFVRGFTCA